MGQNLSLKLYDSLTSLSEQNVNNLLDEPMILDNDVHISKVIGTLLERNIYESFTVLDKKIFVINTRDLLNIKDISTQKISTIAKISPVLYTDSKIANAAHTMNYYRLRSLPILEKDKKLKGQINAKSIIQLIYELATIGTSKNNNNKTNTNNNSFASLSKKILGKHIMTPKPFVIGSKNNVSTARNMMIKNRIDHLPVIDENNNSLIGMITSTHIIKHQLPSERIGRGTMGISRKNTQLDFPVKSIMSKDVVVADIEDNLLKIINTLIQTKSTYVILQSVDEIHGIITFGDILTLLKERIQYDLPCYILGLPEDPIESEMTKTKFIGVVKVLKKIFAEIEEARCRIKVKRSGKRNRYEINVNIITTAEIYSYTRTGWDLPRIMDELADGLKRKVIKEQLKKDKPNRIS